jgi:hypothetical protein
MPERTLPGIALKSGWADTESGWGSAMRENLLKLAVMVAPVATVVDELPAEPVAGMIRILSSVALDNPGQIAVFDGPEGEEEWVFFPLTQNFIYYDGFAQSYMRKFNFGEGGYDFVPIPFDQIGSRVQDLQFWFDGAPGASAVIGRFVLTEDMVLAGNLSGSTITIGTPPAVETDLELIAEGDTTVLATITILDDGDWSMATDAGDPVTLLGGVPYVLVGPVVPDAALANIRGALRATS